MKIVLRADGSAAIGLGHLARVLALAVVARRHGYEVVVASAYRDAAAATFAAREGFELHVLDVTPGSAADSVRTLALAGRDALLFADGYAFSPEWLRSLCGARRFVVYIDDWLRQGLGCDAVVNPNVNANAAAYPVELSSVVLAGPDFALVHERFLRARSAKVQRSGTVDRVLVTMGGSDPPGATLDVLRALEFVGLPVDVRVVVGASNSRRAGIVAAAALSSHRVEVVTAVEDMAMWMLWTDVVVTASGVTASELACVGVPGVTFPIVDNQEPIAPALGAHGMFSALPPRSEERVVGGAIERVVGDTQLRSEQVRRQHSIIDGRGAERILERTVAYWRARWGTVNGGASRD